MISIRSLHKYFNKGKQNEIHVINNVDLELPERGMVAIFGKSGCGKTTLLNVIGGLDGFESGELTINGESIRRDPDGLRNRMIGYIFQNYNLNKTETCFENIADALRLCGMTDKQEIETRVMAALANVGMANYRSRLPDALSGGQQQRIAIARAIVKNPRIILADEPTGNLDEASTVLIMDLLKEISRDHLVLLVTHEANLVDHYCNQVIEVQDGCIRNIRANTDANGFTARDKNDIFLGELEHTSGSAGNAEIEYFGDKPAEPVRLRLVNSGGKLYVQIQSPNVQVLDGSSEVKLREGVFQYEERAKEQRASIDMSKLPPVQGTRFGRLFTFASSLKSGYNANFHKQKKGKKLLRRCMGLFAAVLVIVSALFGTAIDKLISADQSYNHNTFYVYTPSDGAVSARLNEALASGTAGIDKVYLRTGYPTGDGSVSFYTGFFETFSPDYIMGESDLSSNAVFLSHDLASALTTVAGSTADPQKQEMFITTAVADKLLEKSTVGYIREYRDLLGLIASRVTLDQSFYSGSFSVDGQAVRISAVVQSDEYAVYFSDHALMQNFMRWYSNYLRVAPASAFGVTVADGETVLRINSRELKYELPSVGDKVQIQGQKLNVTSMQVFSNDYNDWCEQKGIKHLSIDKWLIQQGFTDSADDMETHYYKYYLTYYYAEIGEFMQDFAVSYPSDRDVWLYTQKGITDAKYALLTPDISAASYFYELNRRYPTRTEMQELGLDYEYSYEVRFKDVWYRYEEEYWQYISTQNTYAFTDSWLYLLSDADYNRLAVLYGPSDISVTQNGNYLVGVVEDVDYGMTVFSGMIYTVVHTSNPGATAAFLAQEFPNLTTGNEYYNAILTPSDIYQNVIKDQWSSISTNLVIMAVLMILMSVCMYFIMRSALMSRVKEIGIYRAIGVSRKNLVYRFFMEALVLTTLTVFVGFLISAAAMNLWIGLSPLLGQLFFFPLWFALLLLAVIYAVCLLCGTIPILLLLSKTPSEILAKYDI